ncbi:hypothetical protein H2O64_16315 [Kordia sp. YSTF-M3]|uniref:Uncharacterized protein n=1 Tax=Kordia aestuariivivens TaxID=2759037 RepID=A0ABR7QCF1_9FLAO|nr:hypothetical protein [Kordia aestuariivivens]MBC8756241.1 hypothetical protein [Kordia aestuariivivens]
MEDFLERIQLVQRKQIKLPVDKSEFIKAFRQNVDEGEIGMFSGMFEAFTTSKNRFKGNISNNDFEIRRRKVLFQRNQLFARIKGTFRQQADHVVVDLTINGFSKMIIPFYVLTIAFYIFFITTISNGLELLSPFFLFMVIHAILMFAIPYFVMRRSVKSTAADIEKELFFMTREKSGMY